MDASTTCADSVFEDVGIKAYVNNLKGELEKSSIKHEGRSCNNNGETAEVMFSNDDTSKLEELGNAVDGLRIQGVQEGIACEIHHRKIENISPELKSNHTTASTAKIQKNLSKCATFPVSEKTPLSPTSMDGKAESAYMAADGQNSLKSQNPACSRSMSLPTSLKLVSALKGGREQQGMPRVEKINVTWAPDVYDPPTTSMSHTVRNHHQRSKSKKKDQKHRHKGKSSRGSSSEKKHHSTRRNMGNVNLSPLRLPAQGNRLLQADGFDQLALEVMPPAVDALKTSDCFDQSRSSADVGSSSIGISSSNQDSKCGQSFFGASSLGKLHLSATEAT